MRIFNLCGVTAALLLLSGCATMFTGTKQDIEVRTQNDVVGSKLDNIVKVDVIADAYRVKYGDVAPGEIIEIHRKGEPVAVQVKESKCILPSEERFDNSMHPAVLLDVLATSPLSTSIDSSTGAMWRYDKTMTVTPKVKDTPECQEWLKNEVSKMNEVISSKKLGTKLEINKNKFPYDNNSVVHPYGTTK